MNHYEPGKGLVPAITSPAAQGCPAVRRCCMTSRGTGSPVRMRRMHWGNDLRASCKGPGGRKNSMSNDPGHSALSAIILKICVYHCLSVTLLYISPAILEETSIPLVEAEMCYICSLRWPGQLVAARTALIENLRQESRSENRRFSFKMPFDHCQNPVQLAILTLTVISCHLPALRPYSLNMSRSRTGLCPYKLLYCLFFLSALIRDKFCTWSDANKISLRMPMSSSANWLHKWDHCQHILIIL